MSPSCWLGARNDIPDILTQIDALAVPSTGLESAPRTIAEAQTVGCPVVASDIGGIAELLDEGAAGRLVAPGDREGLCAALRAVTQDADLRQRYIAHGQRRAEEYYRPAAFARRCEAVFDRLLQRCCV